MTSYYLHVILKTWERPGYKAIVMSYYLGPSMARCIMGPQPFYEESGAGFWLARL